MTLLRIHTYILLTALCAGGPLLSGAAQDARVTSASLAPRVNAPPAAAPPASLPFAPIAGEFLPAQAYLTPTTATARPLKLMRGTADSTMAQTLEAALRAAGVTTSSKPALPGMAPAKPQNTPAIRAVVATPKPSPTPTPTPEPTPAGKNPGLHLKLDTDDVHIGDAVTVRLEADDPDVTPDRISGVQFEPDAEKWHVETPFRLNPGDKNKKTAPGWLAVLRPFDTSNVPIPPFKVNYRDAAGQPATAQTTTATLHVLALRPPGNKETTLLGLRDPAEIPRDWIWLAVTLGILIALGLTAWLAIRWWLRRARLAYGPPEPDLPPGLWALRELDHRARLPVCQNGPAKAIFSHVSEVVRLYLGRRYGVTAIDMTTYECLQALATLHLGEEVLRWIREFLDECDLVKFTTHEPSRERWKTIWHDARLIIKMTTPPDELGEVASGAQPREALV